MQTSFAKKREKNRNGNVFNCDIEKQCAHEVKASEVVMRLCFQSLILRNAFVSKKVDGILHRFQSSSCTRAMLPSLRKWHDVVAAIPTSEILPLGFGNKSRNDVKQAAFYGDRLIGQQVVLQIRTFFSFLKDSVRDSNIELKHQDRRHGMGSLGPLYGVATSNQMFAEELKAILPSHAPRNIAIVSRKKVHDAGTMVEAAVFAVSNLSEPEKDEAISVLAKYLIAQAAQVNTGRLISREMNKTLLAFLKESYRYPTGTLEYDIGTSDLGERKDIKRWSTI